MLQQSAYGLYFVIDQELAVYLKTYLLLKTITKYTDVELLGMIKQRNVAGLSFLYDKYAPAVYGAVFKETGNKEIAEFAIEKTFLQIWSDPSMDERYTGHLLLWLLGIAKKITPFALASVEIENIATENNFIPANVTGINYMSILPVQLSP